jgi:precorrin-6B methylase 2
VSEPRPPHAPLETASPEGTRRSTSFFDAYPLFYETSATSPARDRLNLRYEAIFGENRDIFEGARVLDIASHDGRWSLAALATGAAAVTGIEARPELVEHAQRNLAAYGYGPDRARFITGDVFDVFAREDFEFDVVLCLGFLYHTLRYTELFDGIARARPGHVVIDTWARSMMRKVPMVEIQQERVERQGNAVADSFTHGDTVLIGRPNLRAIRVMLRHYGYRVERLSDWAGLLRDNPGMEGIKVYRERQRVTIRCVRKPTE